MLSGCGQGKIGDLIDMVNENPTVYFGDYDNLQYISLEYVAEKDKYYLLYQGKNTSNNIIRTYNLKAYFYISNSEWVLHEVEKELTNTYLDIVGTRWETTPIRRYSEQQGEFVLSKEELKILEVAEDNESISIMFGNEEIVFTREHTERDDIEFAYVSANRTEQILLRYNITYDGKNSRILMYLDYKPSDCGIMPDLEFTLAD